MYVLPTFKGCRLATCRVLRLHYLHVLPTFGTVGWQPTDTYGILRTFKAAGPYGVLKLHYLYILPTLRAAGWQPTGFWCCIACIFCLPLRSFKAAGWQPTGFWGCITCIFCLLLGLQVGNMQGFDAALPACSAYFWGCRFGTYRVGGCITCMFCLLGGLQVGNLYYWAWNLWFNNYKHVYDGIQKKQ